MTKDENSLPPPDVKLRQRTTRVCQKCGGAWPTEYKVNGIQLFECRRRAPGLGDRPGERAHWKTTLATEGCGEWMQR